MGDRLPRVSHYDTRALQRAMWSDAAVDSLFSIYVTAQTDSLEAAGCIYGRVAKDTLVVERVVRAKEEMRTSHSVGYSCPDHVGLMGRYHTHIALAENDGRPVVIPSENDRRNFWRNADEVLMVIGVGYSDGLGGDELVALIALRDGREGYAWWRRA